MDENWGTPMTQETFTLDVEKPMGKPIQKMIGSLMMGKLHI